MCKNCGNFNNWNWRRGRCNSCGCTEKRGEKGETGAQGKPGENGANAFISNKSGIIAYKLGGQTKATKLVAINNRVDSVPAANASVILLKALQSTQQYIINNDPINDMNVYPQSGDQFLGSSVNIPLLVPPGSRLLVFCYEDGVWTY